MIFETFLGVLIALWLVLVVDYFVEQLLDRYKGSG